MNLVKIVALLFSVFFAPSVWGEETVAPPSSLPTSTNALPASYRIGSEDLVEISVWKNPDLSLTVTVRPDGMISMPLLGDIQAQGRTPSELQREIQARLKEYMETPNVSIIVREIQSQAFFILGEVVHPGKYPLKSETTLLQAVSIAGGFSQWAEKDRMIILRRESPQEQRITIRYKQILSGKIPNADITLKPGDTVIIP